MCVFDTVLLTYRENSVLTAWARIEGAGAIAFPENMGAADHSQATQVWTSRSAKECRGVIVALQ
jgi:hypothetical protein